MQIEYFSNTDFQVSDQRICKSPSQMLSFLGTTFSILILQIQNARGIDIIIPFGNITKYYKVP
jgi:hypothetical protein